LCHNHKEKGVWKMKMRQTYIKAQNIYIGKLLFTNVETSKRQGKGRNWRIRGIR